jgi:hypothetical protein
MSTVKLKQIDGHFDGLFVISGLASGAASSTVITTQLTAAVSTAGKGGVSVPLQVGGTGTEGVITNTIVEVFNSTSKDKIIADGEGNEVYGKISEAGGVYTLSYFYLTNAGTETAYTFASTQNVDFTVRYRYSLKNLPEDFATRASTFISQDAGSVGAITSIIQQLTVTGTNTITALTLPSGYEVKHVFNININGIDEALNGMAIAANGTVTVTAATLGYDVETTDFVKAAVVIGLI